jgi:hypothetical protein
MVITGIIEYCDDFFPPVEPDSLYKHILRIYPARKTYHYNFPPTWRGRETRRYRATGGYF